MTLPEKAVRKTIFMSKPTQGTSQGGKLERPSHPDPFRFEKQQGKHGNGADAKNKPVAAAILRVFFVLFHRYGKIDMIGNGGQSLSR